MAEVVSTTVDTLVVQFLITDVTTKNNILSLATFKS